MVKKTIKTIWSACRLRASSYLSMEGLCYNGIAIKNWPSAKDNRKRK